MKKLEKLIPLHLLTIDCTERMQSLVLRLSQFSILSWEQRTEKLHKFSRISLIYFGENEEWRN